MQGQFKQPATVLHTAIDAGKSSPVTEREKLEFELDPPGAH